MKYIVIPLLKVLWVIIYLVTMIPTMLMVCIVASIWSFNLKAFSHWKNVPYAVQDATEAMVIAVLFEEEFRYYSYETIFDWFWNRKTWHK